MLGRPVAAGFHSVGPSGMILRIDATSGRRSCPLAGVSCRRHVGVQWGGFRCLHAPQTPSAAVVCSFLCLMGEPCSDEENRVSGTQNPRQGGRDAWFACVFVEHAAQIFRFIPGPISVVH